MRMDGVLLRPWQYCVLLLSGAAVLRTNSSSAEQRTSGSEVMLSGIFTFRGLEELKFKSFSELRFLAAVAVFLKREFKAWDNLYTNPFKSIQVCFFSTDSHSSLHVLFECRPSASHVLKLMATKGAKSTYVREFMLLKQRRYSDPTKQCKRRTMKWLCSRGSRMPLTYHFINFLYGTPLINESG